MDFLTQKTQILLMMQKGDRKKIAQRAGVSVYRLKDALEKNNFHEMTNSQRKAYAEAVKYMLERAKENKEILLQTQEIGSDQFN